ncbi:MAG TPA: hypothetical protein VN151_07515 [Terracidiphilus sp.]|nr:hypothetical protein [Terracidiphilus sp.]
MTRSKLATGGTILTLALLTSTTALLGQAVATAPLAAKLTDPTKQPVAKISADPNLFGWQMFVYVNWPELSGNRGVPDSRGQLGQAGPTVWESYKNVSEIYQANGQKPVAWEVDDELPTASSLKAAISKEQLAALGPVDSNWIHFLAEPVMIDGQQICDSASRVIRYDVRGDRPYYDYVVNNTSGHQLYNIEGQQAALADPNFVFAFPTDAIEVKASWRILGTNDDGSRYWTSIGVYYDNNHILRSSRIGLTGLHITSKVVPDWVWITFEQVDNPTATYKWFLGQKGAALGPNPNFDTSLAPLNREMQQDLAPTKWQYYALMKVQIAYINPSNQPILMSNTQMETYFQSNSSCISCHNLASIGKPQNSTQGLRLNVFYPLQPYIGTIDFQSIANQQFPGESFKAMDFVWSLRNAHSASAAAHVQKHTVTPHTSSK